MNIQIRKAVKEDGKAIMDLIHELAIYEKAPEQVTVAFDHFMDSGFGHHPVWWAFVAENTRENNEKEIIGFALYYIRYSTWKGQRMYLEDLIVTEKMRRFGIGKLLMDALMVEAKEKKLSAIHWQVLDWNEPAINFYKKLGDVSFDDGWINVTIDIQ